MSGEKSIFSEGLEQGETLAIALSPLTDLEIRDRVTALRNAGQLGDREGVNRALGREVTLRGTVMGVGERPETPPPASADTVDLAPIRPSPLPREIIEERAVEAVETLPPPSSRAGITGSQGSGVVNLPAVVRASFFEAAQGDVPAKFPRTAIVLEMAAVADRLRIAARAIDHLCATAILHEPGTLRRKAHALVRLAWGDIAKRVVLAVCLVLAVACGGATEPGQSDPLSCPSDGQAVATKIGPCECLRAGYDRFSETKEPGCILQEPTGQYCCHARPAPLKCTTVDLAGYCSNTRCVSILECNRAPTADDYPDATCKSVDEGRFSCCFPSVPGGCE